MKRIWKQIVSFALTGCMVCGMVVAAPAELQPMEKVEASDFNIIYEYHHHEGNASVQGGCYTTPKYHVHSSGCYGNCPGRYKYQYVISGSIEHGYTIYVQCDVCGNGKQTFYDDGKPDTPFPNYAYGGCSRTDVLKCGKNENMLEGYMVSCGYKEGDIVSARMELSDVSTVDTKSASFKSFATNATKYTWYYFEGDWQEIGSIRVNDTANAGIENNGRIFDIEMVDDVIGEKISVLTIRNTVRDKDDNLRVRCVAEGGTPLDSEATLHIVRNGYKEIMASFYKNLEVGTVIDISDILVSLLYESGAAAFSSGWSNLYFVVQDEDGNEQEVKNVRVEYGENIYRVRLKDENPDPTDTTKETTLRVNGIDTQLPVVESVSLSEYVVRSEEENAEPQNIIVTLEGSDSYTPAEQLLYALKLQGEDPGEDEFSSQKEYEISVQENSIYVAYIKDSAGNMGSEEIPIVLIDGENPLIVSASLAFPVEEGWVNKNMIEVEATDNYLPEMLTYRFTSLDEEKSNKKDDKEEDAYGIGTWITENRIVIDKNGIYNVEVMDSVGNISATQIEVINIDQKSPDIKKIEIIAIS